MDYIDTFCSKMETRAINQKLRSLYTMWYVQKVESFNQDNIIEEKEKSLNPLHLLTCTDSYLESINRVMVFGQEAHDTLNENTLYTFPPEKYYLSEESYSYNKSIHAGDRKKAPRTLFLKQRLKIAGLDLDSLGSGALTDHDVVRFESVLLNNLNKTSYKGDHTPVKSDGILADIYQNVEYEAKSYTVFEHEFRILRPNRIVFLCGKGYGRHIERDFSTMLDYNGVIKPALNKLSLKDDNCIVSAPISFQYEDVANETIHARAILCYHPNAHMTYGQRKDYNREILEFIEG